MCVHISGVSFFFLSIFIHLLPSSVAVVVVVVFFFIFNSDRCVFWPFYLFPSLWGFVPAVCVCLPTSGNSILMLSACSIE